MLIGREFRHAIRAMTFDEVALAHGALKRLHRGTMIDVGAHYGSALRSFAHDGWTIHAFEPDPANRDVLRRRVAEWGVEVTVDERAVSEADGEVAQLFTSDVSSGISSLTPFHPSHVATTETTTVRLDTYLRSSAIRHVDFLKTDVEGHDLPALRSFPWDTIHPLVVVCEFEDRKTAQYGHTTVDLGEFLVAKGYEVLVSEWHPIVEYGQRHRWRALYPFGQREPRPDSWGNFIASDQETARRLLRHGLVAGRLGRVPDLAFRLWSR